MDEVTQSCKACSGQLPLHSIEPIVCDCCGEPLCLRCSIESLPDDPDTTICSRCIAETTRREAEAEAEVKRRKWLSACHVCGGEKTAHGEILVECELCKQPVCSSMSWKSCGTFMTNGHFRGFYLCSKHLERCSKQGCRNMLRDGLHGVCQFPECFNFRCADVPKWWYDGLSNVVVCHAHVYSCDQCLCFRQYPATQHRTVKLRGRAPIGMCRDCYHVRWEISTVLLQLKMRQYPGLLSKDLINIIMSNLTYG